MVRRSTASIVQNGSDQNVYLVVDDFGRSGEKPTLKKRTLSPLFAKRASCDEPGKA